jgi:hypothetical protein
MLCQRGMLRDKIPVGVNLPERQHVQ